MWSVAAWTRAPHSGRRLGARRLWRPLWAAAVPRQAVRRLCPDKPSNSCRTPGIHAAAGTFATYYACACDNVEICIDHFAWLEGL